MKGVKKQDLPVKICATCGRPLPGVKKGKRFGKKLNTFQTNAGAIADRDLETN